MRAVAAVLGAALSVVAAGAELEAMQFTERFVSEVKARLPDAQVKISGPLRVQVKTSEGSKYAAFLDSAYSQYRGDPARLDDILRGQLESITSQGRPAPAKTATSILAVLKSRDYIATVKRQLRQAGFGDRDFPLHERLNDDLYAFYVFDTANDMRFITKKDAADADVREDALRAVAAANLEKYFEANPPRIARLAGGGAARIYAVAVDENYEASTLLVPKYWNKRFFDVSGKIVAYVPARDIVLVTGSDDNEGMRLAAQIANKAYAEVGYPISPAGYVLENGRWVRYAP